MPPTPMPPMERASAANNWLAAIPRSERASAANNWLAAIPRTARRTDERLLPPMMDRRRDDDPTRWYFARKKKGTDFRRFDGMDMMKKRGDKTATMSAGAFAMSMISVGLLFFVIGYGYSKGRKAA